MKFEEIVRKYGSKSLKIKGRNCEEFESNFVPISNSSHLNVNDIYLAIISSLEHKIKFEKNEKIKAKLIKQKDELTVEQVQDLLKDLENLYCSIYNKADKEVDILTPLTISDKGEVVVEERTPYHKVNADIDMLDSISKFGVVASEWFGMLEAEKEGRYCAFATKSTSSNTSHPMRNRNQIKSCPKEECKLIFDVHHPVMQKLLAIDYFEYAKVLYSGSEEDLSQYSPRIRNIYDNLIDPLSHAKKMHTNDKLEFYDWLAIPCGIPPQLIVGVVINTENVEMIKNLDKISQMFPNATIFDQNMHTLRLSPLSSDKGVQA